MSAASCSSGLDKAREGRGLSQRSCSSERQMEIFSEGWAKIYADLEGFLTITLLIYKVPGLSVTACFSNTTV